MSNFQIHTVGNVTDHSVDSSYNFLNDLSVSSSFPTGQCPMLNNIDTVSTPISYFSSENPKIANLNSPIFRYDSDTNIFVLTSGISEDVEMENSFSFNGNLNPNATSFFPVQ